MAVLAAVTNGNLTSSATWALVDSTSYLNSETGNTAVTTSLVASSTFTPGAITVDGIGLKIASVAASPSGTITAKLTLVAGLVDVDSVTVNVSDLPSCSATSGTTTPVDTAEGGWFFFKFGSSHLLAGASAYEIRVQTSVSSQVNLWRDSTAANWSRYLRTTTTQAPVAGDDLVIVGEWTAAATFTARTVTMNSTANTNYGSNTTSQVTPAMSICKSGTLAWGTAASTTYILQIAGYIIVYNGGTYSQGASGSEIPRGSTATLQFNCANAGDFGLVGRNGSIVNFYGLSRTVGNNTVICKLAANAAAAATALTTDVSTGWLNGDSVCYAPTSRTSTEFEKKALTADASGTSLTSTALTNAHNGTSPTQGEVGLLTRNNVVTAVTSAKGGFIFAGSTCTFVSSFTEHIIFGANATSKRGLVPNTTTGSVLVDHCSFHDTPDIGFTIVGAGNSSNVITVQYSVFYNCTVAAVANLNTGFAGWTIDHCMFCGTNGSANIVSWNSGGSGTFTNNSVSGANAPNAACYFTANVTFAAFTGNSIHSNAGTSFITSAPFTGTIDSCQIWRNTGNFTIGGGQWSTSSQGLGLTISNCNFFGNTSVNLSLNYSEPTNCAIVISSTTMGGDTSFGTNENISWNGNMAGTITMQNCQLSKTTGIKVPVTAADFDNGNNRKLIQIIADNCTFIANASLVTNASNFLPGDRPFLQSQNHGQVANDNRAYFYISGDANACVFNIMQSDSGTVHGSDPLSQKMSPNTSNWKFQSTPFYIKANSGSTPTVGVWIQKNSSYNGNAPRLISLRQDSMGVTSNVVAATFSAAANTWQQLTYVCPSAPQDGVYAFLVDCDGTAGAIFVGDWSQS